MRKIIRRLQGQRSAFSGQRSDCTLNAIRCPLKLIFFLMLFCTLSAVRCPLSHANNISVSSVTTDAQDTGNDTLEIQFNLSWENSWRDATNYDAAWVFVKYSTDSGVTWNHAYLSATAGDHTMPAGYECKVGTTDVSGSKGVGVFIQRSSTGSGTASLSGVKLIWNYAENTNDVVTDDEAAHPITTQIRVMAIEMVHIPEGTFSAGSGGAESSCFTKTMIDTANATTAPSGSPLAGGYPSDQTVPNNASWPNGFGA
ncbi:MAG: hypothetical protein ISS90_02330, partial [Candidatus Omnitrophica bacterium]|nr:hypothetical protein [Candidatus Omnitrophota bacterium]